MSRAKWFEFVDEDEDEIINVGLHGEWDPNDHSFLGCNGLYKEKDIRKAGLPKSYASDYKGYDPTIWIIKGDSEEDRKIKLKRQKKIDQLPMKKTVHFSIDLELERADCSGCYQLTEQSELELARQLRLAKFDITYVSKGFIPALNPRLSVHDFHKRCQDDESDRLSSFEDQWAKYLENEDLPDMAELFTRLMSTTEMRAILKKAAQESGKELDESQLNLLASNQELAKAYVKPILDTIQAQPQTAQPKQSNALEQLAEEMLNTQAVQQKIRKSLTVTVSDEQFEALLQDPRFKQTCIENIIQDILKGKMSTTSNGSKLDDLINPATEAQPESEAESQQQTQQPDQNQTESQH